MRAKFVNENIKHLSARSTQEVDKNLTDDLKNWGYDDIDVSKVYNFNGEDIKIIDVFSEGVGLSYEECIEYEILSGKNKGEKTWCSIADFYRHINKMNEAIKHLQPRPMEEVIDNIEESGNLAYQMYMGLMNNLEDTVQSVLNKNAIEGKNTEDNPIYLLGSFFLTNEELSFKHSGSWYFDKEGKMYCKKFDGEIDEMCEEFIEFLKNHKIEYKQIGKASYFNTYVQFTGNAKDIIKLVLEYFTGGYQRYEYMLDQAYDIIFAG